MENFEIIIMYLVLFRPNRLHSIHRVESDVKLSLDPIILPSDLIIRRKSQSDGVHFLTSQSPAIEKYLDRPGRMEYRRLISS